jgi:hypothetical protein
MSNAYDATRYAAPLAFALAAWAISRRRQPFLANHVVMAAHFDAFRYLAAVGAGLIPGPTISAWIGVGVSAAYLFLTLRRLFGEGWRRTLWKAAILYLVMVVVEMGLALGAVLWASQSAA